MVSKESLAMARKIKLGVRRGVAKALLEHKLAGRSIVVARNGKIITIPPEKIRVFKVR